MSEPLRVALLVDSLVVPRWAARLVEEIHASPDARLVAVIVGRPAPAARRNAVHRLYARLDARLFPGRPDALAETDLRPLLRDCPAVGFEPLRSADGDDLRPEDAERIRALDLDVALNAGARPPAGRLRAIARHGVWSFRQGDSPDGFVEVTAGHPTFRSRLELAVNGGGAPRVLYEGVGRTDRRSVRRNLNASWWKTLHFAPRKLRELREEGPAALADAPPAPPAGGPGGLATAALWLRLVLRYVRDKVRDLATVEQWYLAYRFEQGVHAPDDLRGLTRLMPPGDRFWADPFPVQRNGRSWIFFEELPFATGRGALRALELDPQRGPQAPITVMEREFHLSYPFVFEWGGELFMVPEMAAARRVPLFRCRSFPDVWEEEQVLLDGVRAVDATLEEVDGRWWMFVNIAPEGGETWDELHLFHAPTPLGPWEPHRRNPVRSDCRASRPAGRLFRHGGALYRPAQNCGPEYGASIALHRVLKLDARHYEEELVREIRGAPGLPGSRIHTMNRTGDLFVVDLLRRKRRPLFPRP